MTTDTTTEAPPAAPAGPIVFLRLPEVLRRVPLGRTAWYAAIKEEGAPKPVKLGGVAMWPEREIDAYARKLMAWRG